MVKRERVQVANEDGEDRMGMGMMRVKVRTMQLKMTMRYGNQLTRVRIGIVKRGRRPERCADEADDLVVTDDERLRNHQKRKRALLNNDITIVNNINATDTHHPHAHYPTDQLEREKQSRTPPSTK